jgi:hypothetical protein
MTSDLKCSRAGCSLKADWFIYWRNPKVHSVERKKTWLSCESHKQFFVDYLSVREFFLEAEFIE